MIRVYYIIVFVCSFLYGKGQEFAVQFSQLDVQKGLSHNQVNAIIKDAKGYLWFGTPSGLNRYDGKDIRVFRHSNQDQTSLSDNTINDLFIGPEGKLWVKTRLGFNIYDQQRESFERQADSLFKSVYPFIDVVDIEEDSNGNFWFLYQNQGLYRYSHQSKKFQKYNTQKKDCRITGIVNSVGGLWIVYEDGFLERIDSDNFKQLFSTRATASPTRADYRIFNDRDGGIWLYAKNLPLGVYYFAAGHKKSLHLHTNSKHAPLNTNLLSNITEDDKGRIWLATDHGGINLVDKETFRIEYLVNQEYNERSLAQNSSISLYKDKDGIIWIGTYKRGVSYFHEHIIKFPVYRHQAGDSPSLYYDDVNRLVEDRYGNLWIGTNEGGLIYFNRKNNTFKQYKHDPHDPGSISSNIIVSLLLDKNHDLWIGTYHGGLNKFDGKTFTRYLHDPNNSKTISDNSVWELLEDSKGRIWVGTLTGGLNLFDRGKNTFKRIGYNGDNTPQSNYTSALMEDRDGNIWVGSATGIDVLDNRSQRFYHIGNQPGNTNSLSNDFVTDFYQDKSGDIWIATRDGVNKYNPEKKHFTIFRQEDGLADNSVLTILEDRQGTLWFSTLKGLSAMHRSRADPAQVSFRNYDSRDGLQANSFNENAALRTRKGELVFGGPSGFNIIDPSTIQESAESPHPILSDFQLFNKSVKIGEELNGRVILDKAPSEIKTITLSHNQNMFSLIFTSLDFFNKGHSKFQYKLEGFDEKWIQTDPGANKATFTNLDPGSYTFKVKVAANEGKWSNEYSLVTVIIQPPFWKTPLAYFLYAVFIVCVLSGIRHIERQREKSRFRLQQEQEEANRIRELDAMKTRFFTNVSHEFRTPISLILAPLDKLMLTASEGQRGHLNLMQRNAGRLLNLVNQLLDFRKIDVQELKLNELPGDIVEAISQYVVSFTDMAEKKQIDYIFKQNVKQFYTSFDHDKLERILFNLLSNAFKFTPDGGKIEVELKLKLNVSNETAQLQIRISDNGIGIPEDKIDRIFNRYFQQEMPVDLINQGSGIGLSITKEYIQLVGGTISVESKVNEGSCFTVMLPLHRNHLANSDLQNNIVSIKNKSAEEDLPPAPALSHERKQRVLVIEDNEDFRFYLKDNLRPFYMIEEASDAEAGWRKALASHPDIIVSDVNMPKGNGIDLCKKLKTDPRTRHIPVILLTAVADESSNLRGLETGAVDYIIKPFNFELLLSKMKNQLQQKVSLEKTYKKQLTVRPAQLEVQSTDEKFLNSVLAEAEANLHQATFSIEFLAERMCMSRVNLYKRILLLTGYTPSEFVRNLRLKRAAQLLQESQLTIAEIAYEVGFSNPKQFSKYFKSLYGVLPSVYRNQEIVNETTPNC